MSDQQDDLVLVAMTSLSMELPFFFCRSNASLPTLFSNLGISPSCDSGGFFFLGEGVFFILLGSIF